MSVIADSEYTSVGAYIDIDLATRIAEADTVPTGGSLFDRHAVRTILYVPASQEV
jgi:hypothetical protein